METCSAFAKKPVRKYSVRDLAAGKFDPAQAGRNPEKRYGLLTAPVQDNLRGDARLQTQVMSSIGSATSFWQQDQNFYSSNNSSYDQEIATVDAVTNAMASAETSLGKGLASIANGEALTRTNSTLIADIQSALQSSGSSSSSTSSSSGSSSSATSTGSPANTGPTAASGIGTTVLSTNTSLSSLGMYANGTFAITAGDASTTYTATGTDTVGDLINAINVDLPTNAQVTASLDNTGHLVITSRNTSDIIVIGGSGTDQANLGFGVGNKEFMPGTGSAGSSGTSDSSSTSSTSGSASSTSSTSASSASSSSSTSSAASTASALLGVASAFTNSGESAVSVLASSGVAGSLVDMLT